MPWFEHLPQPHLSILILTLPLGSQVIRLLQVITWSGPLTMEPVESSITILAFTVTHSETTAPACAALRRALWSPPLLYFEGGQRGAELARRHAV